MASVTIPVSIAQRHKLLFTGKAPAAELRRLGDLHRERGLLHDALEFYRSVGNDDAIQALAAAAEAEADLVLFLNAARALGKEPDRAALKRLAEAARRLGKESTALKADALLSA